MSRNKPLFKNGAVMCSVFAAEVVDLYCSGRHLPANQVATLHRKVDGQDA